MLPTMEEEIAESNIIHHFAELDMNTEGAAEDQHGMSYQLIAFFSKKYPQPNWEKAYVNYLVWSEQYIDVVTRYQGFRPIGISFPAAVTITGAPLVKSAPIRTIASEKQGEVSSSSVTGSLAFSAPAPTREPHWQSKITFSSLTVGSSTVRK